MVSLLLGSTRKLTLTLNRRGRLNLAVVCLLARLWGGSVGSLHELIVRLQCRVPLDYPAFATLTLLATAVSNGQLSITHAVLRSAMRTTKVKLREGRRAAHNSILHVVCESKSPRTLLWPVQSSRLAEFGGRGMSFNICRGTLRSLAISQR
jgi:hypothetical protein